MDTAPYFFLSYSRTNLDSYFKKFCRELASTISLKTGCTPATAGFVDYEINVGEEWPVALSKALQGCQVFVPFYTPAYFKSDYCGREWQVIRDRQDAFLATCPAETPRPPVILPILWAAENELPANLPSAVTDLQFNHAAFGDFYAKEGLFQLLRLNKHRDK